MSLPPRFTSKTKVAPSGCVEWTAHRFERGYGFFRYKGKGRRAHRVAWELLRGPIPPEMLVLHRCDNPACVNIDHLFLGTASDNMQDAFRKGRRLRSHLTAEQIARIKTGGENAFAVAADLGITPEWVWQIRKGRILKPADA